MAFAREVFSGNGANRLFAVNFPYLSRSHVEVRVDGVLEASPTWINATTVELAVAPANGAQVEVKRNTPKTTRLVDWSDGSAVREADLDLADIQVLYITQEAFDASDLTIGENAQGRWDAENKRIINVAAPVDPNDAVNKAYVDPVVNTAQTAANTATTQAGIATTQANLAEAARLAAESARNDAQTAAATLPVATPGDADKWLKINVGGTGWSYRTSVELLGDIGAVPTTRTVSAGSGLSGGGDLSANRTLSVDSAVVALLAGAQAFTGAKRYTPVTLTDAATITWDLDAAPIGSVTLAGNRTVGAPTNQRNGGCFILIVNQDGTGSRTLAWNAAFDFGTEGTPVLPTGANKVAIFTFLSNGTSMRCIGRWNN